MQANGGQRLGYVRVSTVDQSTERQLEGIDLDKIFTDQASGKSAERPKLMELLSYARHGDVVIVHSIDRLARNLDDLRRLIKDLTSRGVRVEFLKENLVFTGEDSPVANLTLSLLGAFAEFERSIIRERQREGIALAKKRGVYKGRKRALTPEASATLKERVKQGEKISALARELHLSRQTLYKNFRE